jgi:hypothetical protein
MLSSLAQAIAFALLGAISSVIRADSGTGYYVECSPLSDATFPNGIDLTVSTNTLLKTDVTGGLSNPFWALSARSVSDAFASTSRERPEQIVGN